MARIAANGGPMGVNATLGLSANSLETFLNNSDGSITNFGLITRTYSFTPGAYSFSWAYAAADYQPFNDGAVFSLVGGGTQQLISLARNGSSPSDLSGPSPDTLILGSYGSTAWLTTSFTVASAGNYQVGFAAYNWDDSSLSPNLFVSGIAGTFTGTPVSTSGGTPTPPIIGGSGGNVDDAVFDTSSAAYAEPTLTFEGGTLQYSADTTTAKDIVLNGTGGAIDTDTHDASITGTISGTGSLTKQGAGALELSDANTFTGAVSVQAGTLALTGSGSVATSSGVAVDGTLDISGTNTGASVQTLSGTGTTALGDKKLTIAAASTTFSGAIIGSGDLEIAAGQMTLAGANTYTGVTTIADGTLKLSGAGSIALSDKIVNDAVLDVSAVTSTASLKTLEGSGEVKLGTKNLTLTEGSTTFAGTINGAGSLQLTGGEMTLAGVNTYTGTTTIANGTLKLAGSGSAALSEKVINNSVLDLSGVTATASIKTLEGTGEVKLGSKTLALTDGSTTFAGTIVGSGTLQLTGGEMTLGGENSYTGTTTIANGTLKLTGNGSVALSDKIVNNSILDISNLTNTHALIKTLTGMGEVKLGVKSLTVTAGSTTFDGAIKGSGGFKLTGGEITLGGENTYTGSTTIAGGTLKLTGNGSVANSSVIVNDGVLDVSGLASDVNVQSMNGAGTVELGSKSLTFAAAADTFSGSFSGSGSIALAGGVLTLDGASTHTGGMTVLSTAKLVVASDAALGGTTGVLSLNGGTLENSASMTMERELRVASTSAIETMAGTSLTNAGALSGTGAIVKSGAGTLVLAGDNAQWGSTSDPTSGGLVINEGAVIASSANALGNGALIMNAGILRTATDLILNNPIFLGSGSSSFETAENTRATIAGDVTTLDGGDACFVKGGAGTLVMSGVATIASGTCVQQGNLYSNGQLNSVVTVAPAGVLRGTGIINGAVTVLGTLAPGNSPGVMLTTAPVEMMSGSVYQEDINGLATASGPGSYSRLIILGAGNQFIAGGATLAPNLLNITGSDVYTPYVPQVGDAFRIITAEGGIAGEFSAVAQPEGLAAATRMDVFYDAGNSNSIDLIVVPTSYTSYVSARDGNENARSAAHALDQMSQLKDQHAATEAQEELLYAVNTQSAGALDRKSTQLSGEVHASMLAVAPLANRWLVDSVGRQLTNDAADENGSSWVDLGAEQGNWRNDAVASGFEADRSQIAVGWNLLNGAATRVGVGVLHGTVDVSADQASGSLTQNQAFIYAQYNARVTLEMVAAYGLSDLDTERSDPLAPFGKLKTDAEGHSTLLSAAVRLPLTMRGLALAPYARVSWERISRDTVSEGALSLASISAANYSAQGASFTAGLLGGSIERNPLAERFTYQFNLGIGLDDADLVSPNMRATLAELQTDIRATDIGRAYLRGQVSGTTRLTQRVYGQLGLSGETRDGKSSEIGANLGVQFIF